jgi:hypothetical protein
MHLKSITFHDVWVRYDACKSNNTAAIVFCREDNETVAWLVFKLGLSRTETRFSGNNIPLLYFPESMMSTILVEFHRQNSLTVHYDQGERIGRLTTCEGPVREEEDLPFLI